MRARINKGISVSSRVNFEYCEKLEILADRESRSMSSFIRKALYDYIDRNWKEEYRDEQP